MTKVEITPHFMNSADTLVLDSLLGLEYNNSNIRVLPEHKVVYREDIEKYKTNKVCLISGGGAGHEPAHSGFVGSGMLTATISGNTFASPSTQQIYQGISLCASEGSPGSILIVKRYTGDLLNFGMALEMTRAKDPKTKIDMVVIDDDVGVSGDDSDKSVGQRGLAGTVLVHKFLGGLAEKNFSLEKIVSQGKQFIKSMGTVGVSLDRCTVPANKAPEKEKEHQNNETQIEFGLGIHNEPGYQTLPLLTCKDLIDQVLSKLSEASKNQEKDISLNKGAEIVVLVNNLGGTSKLEESVVVKEVVEWLSSKGIEIRLLLSGTMMTSLNMHGMSITCLSLPKDETTQDLWLECLLLSTPISAWNAANITTGRHIKAIQDYSKDRKSQPSKEKVNSESIKDPSTAYIRGIIIKGCENLLEKVPSITEYDEIAGDGDCGYTMENAAKGIVKLLKTDDCDGAAFQVPSTKTLSELFFSMIDTLDQAMGGTSGALFRIFLLGIAKGLAACEKSNPDTFEDWRSILKISVETLFSHTSARVGDRTLVDSLGSFMDSLTESESSDGKSAMREALRKATDQTDATKQMTPKFGRSSYIQNQRLLDANVPDPGAVAVLAILQGVVDGLLQ